ncbi:MAG: hypothetical protein WDO73_36590 [Ignavibacteriota bacterium]
MCIRVCSVWGEQSWSGSSGVNTAFDIRGASVDSDAAYKTADAEAGDYDQKHPNMPISFQLEKSASSPRRYGA